MEAADAHPVAEEPTMNRTSGLLATAALAASIVAGRSIAGAQAVMPRIGVVVSGSDSIAVDASRLGLISTVTSSGRMHAVTVATTANARTWARRADSVAHVVPANPGAVFRSDPIEMTAPRGGLSYSRVLGVSDAAAHEIISPDFISHQPIRIALTSAQLDLLLQYVARAADFSDSLMLSAKGFASPIRAPALQPGIRVYFEFQVEKPARPNPQNAPPTYPDMLRSARIEGRVLAQFVVDTTGAVELSTFKILKSPHDLFSNAVHLALPNMLFSPAEIGGVKVRQLVQMPFTFTLPPHE